MRLHIILMEDDSGIGYFPNVRVAIVYNAQSTDPLCLDMFINFIFKGVQSS